MRKNSLILIAVCATLLVGSVAAPDSSYAPPRPDPTLPCQEGKLYAQGELERCLSRKRADVLNGEPDRSAECRNRFTDELKRIDEVAAKEGGSCRYLDNGDGTLSDLNTGLMWEKKTYEGVHNVDWAYSWLGVYDSFLLALDGTSTDGTTITGCFAGHCDWRLPSIDELKGIFGFGWCPWRATQCINPNFYPNKGGVDHWSSTSTRLSPGLTAWTVNFGGNTAGVHAVAKVINLPVRAVRGGL